jgi:hypothetical protein
LALLGVAADAVSLHLPDSYYARHEWPYWGALAGFIFICMGIAEVFWTLLPSTHPPLAVFCIGKVIMLSSWFLEAVPGVIVGRFVAIVGFAGIVVQGLAQPGQIFPCIRLESAHDCIVYKTYD